MMIKFLVTPSAFTWLFWLNLAYFVVGMLNIVYHFTNIDYIAMVWMALMSLPLWIKPLGRWLGMKV